MLYIYNNDDNDKGDPKSIAIVAMFLIIAIQKCANHVILYLDRIPKHYSNIILSLFIYMHIYIFTKHAGFAPCSAAAIFWLPAKSVTVAVTKFNFNFNFNHLQNS
jgi:hypothetical protein